MGSELVMLAILGGVVFFVASLLSKSFIDPRKAALGELAARYGGTVADTSWLEMPRYRLRTDAWDLDVVYKAGDDDSPGSTSFRVTPSQPVDVRFSRERHKLDPRRLFGSKDRSIGVEWFDSEFHIETDDQGALLAWLGQGTRDAVAKALRARDVGLSGAGCGKELTGTITDVPTLCGAVDRLLEVTEAVFATRPPVPDALLAHLESDPEPGFRRRCLELLLQDHRLTEQAAAALKLAEADEDLGVRYLAARRGGDRELIRGLLRAGLERPYREEALALVGTGDAGRVTLASGGGELSEAEPPAKAPRGSVSTK